MAQVIVGNSFSLVTGLSPQEHRGLAKALSYTQGNHFSGFGPVTKSLVSKRGEFPTGLLTKVVEHLIVDTAFDVKDERKIPAKSAYFGYRGPTFRKAQQAAVEAFTQQGRGSVVMPTGAGKSLVIAGIVNAMSVRTLIVVPNLELKKQLTETLENVLVNTEDIIVENIDSKSLKNHKDFDLLIIDEAHHTASKTYQKLNKTVWASIYHRAFLTATPYRSNPEENLLFEAITGDCTYELTYQDAVAAKYIVPAEGYFIKVQKQHCHGTTYQQVYNELVVNNEHRNQLIAVLLGRLHGEGKSTLCLVKEIRHGEILSELTGFPFMNGQDEDSRQYLEDFNAGRIKVLIGTTGVIGEGVDTRPCEWVVVASPGKAKSQFQQQIGRGVRTYPGKESAKVVIIKDQSHKFLLRHFNAQRKILIDNYDTPPVELIL